MIRIKRKYISILFIFIFILISSNAKAETDCTIITKLDYHSSMSPAITKNNTFGYNNFEFRLYTTENNTIYRIIVDNTTIDYGIIEYFKKYVNWNCEQTYIENLTVIVGEDSYNYYNIFVFSTSMYNMTKEDEIVYGVKFTDEEFEIYLNRVRLKLFFSDILGLVIGLILSSMVVREIKKSLIVEV